MNTTSSLFVASLGPEPRKIVVDSPFNAFSMANQVDVAQSLKVSVRSVHNWMFWYRKQGEECRLRPPCGRSKLS
ncbi:MAG: hypothetical protein U0798_17430 [Gemmataceae bacterium]